MLKWTCIMVALVAGCSDPINIYLPEEEDETENPESTVDTSDVPTDETGGTVSETAGSVSETTGTASDTGSATVDTGSATVDTSSGTVETDTGSPPCWLSCLPGSSLCEKGSVVQGVCPNAEWCCDPKVVDTDTGTGTGTGIPCTGTCAKTSVCFGPWHEIAGDCPLGNACCEPDTDTGSATVDTDTNPEPCQNGDDPTYICEWRGFCVGKWKEDTDYYCDDPNNKACCHKQY